MVKGDAMKFQVLLLDPDDIKEIMDRVLADDLIRAKEIFLSKLKQLSQ